ncbi:MAG: glycine cleavage system aminomethyltransferase GcvT [Deltaproteobacteria bacterium]|nr:glycine cleavage system aminomethyltransferase GcvT [Deltaproteobacteria bacterium]
MSGTPKITPLVEAHRRAKARLVDFAGFTMPLQYTGILDEHHTVRKAAGLFDVSHMGEVEFTGPRALETADNLVTNNVASLEDGQALYSPICHAHGGIVDDCLVYRFSQEHVRIVINASNIAKDVAHFSSQEVTGCTLEDASERFALMAIQGPEAIGILTTLAGAAVAKIAPFHFAELEAGGVRCTAARTGYTGEDGFEIFCAPTGAEALWEALMEAGRARGLKPCGLGARDTLRLEARLPLYGNDITDETTPLEAGLGWTVKLNAADFIGRDALSKQKAEGLTRKLVCLEMRSRGIARHGYAIHLPDDAGELGERVGEITSGTKSPTLNTAIALGYVPKACAKRGTRVLVAVRGKKVEAEVVKGPFYKRA